MKAIQRSKDIFSWYKDTFTLNGTEKIDHSYAKNNNNLDMELGEGNGTPLQYSCLENPMDGGA